MTMSREAAAYHEAGHAVLAWALGSKVRFVRIDITGGGECQCEDPVEAEGKFILCFAGPASQRKHGPVEAWHGGNDYAQAVKVGECFGISDARASKLIGRAHELVADHWDSIERMADALIERGALEDDEVEALFGPPLDRVKFTEHERRTIIEWAERAPLVEAVRLFGSRAKGFARSRSDVDLAVTATDGNYTRFDEDWQTELTRALMPLHAKLSQYNALGGIVRGYCDTCSVLLFERPGTPTGFKRPLASSPG